MKILQFVSAQWVLRCFVNFCFSLCSIQLLHAAGPSLETLHPPVGTRGAEFSVIARGASLGSTCEVLIQSSGIVCTAIRPRSEEEVELQFRSSENCEIGSHPIRLRTPSGVSELRTLTISPFPTRLEEPKEWNSTAGATSIVGSITGADVDRYEVNLRKGDVFSCEVHGLRLGIGLLDTKLTIRNAEGHVLYDVDDTPMTKQDPCFSFRVKKDCTLHLEIGSSGSSADAESCYVMHLGNFSRPSGIFPLGATRDAHIDLKLIHDAIRDNEWLEECTSKSFPFHNCSATSCSDSIELTMDGVTCPSKIPFRTTPDFDDAVVLRPQIAVLEKNSKLKSSPSFVADGVIEMAGEEDRFTLVTSQSRLLCVEVFAARFGSPLDAVIEVRDGQGRVIASGDDLDSHDPKIEFQAVEGAKYELSVADKRRQGGTLYAYRLEVGGPTAHECISLARRQKTSQARQAIEIPKGNRVLCLLGVKKDDPTLATSLHVSNLPNGLYCISHGELPGTAFLPVVFEASPTCELQGLGLKVQGRMLNPESAVVRYIPFEQRVDLVNGPADAIFQESKLASLALATTNEVPFSVQLETPTLELPIDGNLGIRVKVTRQSNFHSPIDVSIPMLPEWVDGPDRIQIPARETEGIFILRALAQCKPMRWSLIAEATVGIPRKQADDSEYASSSGVEAFSTPLDYPIVSSSIHPLTISRSPCTGTLSDVATEQGSNALMRCSIDFKRSADESFIASLEGLPNRIEAPAIQLKPTDTTIDFRLQVADDAPLGKFQGLVCRISGERNGQTISYCIGRGASLAVSPKGFIQKDAQGRPLSPLEVLRLKHSPDTSPKKELR